MNREMVNEISCSNHSTNVLINQPQKDLKIDPNYKVRAHLLVKNQYGEILHACKKNFSSSYYRKGIRKWFFDHGIVKDADIEIEPTGHNFVIAVGIYETC